MYKKIILFSFISIATSHLVLDFPENSSVCYDISFLKNSTVYSNKHYFDNQNEKIVLKNNFVMYKIHTGRLVESSAYNQRNNMKIMSVPFLNNLFLCEEKHAVLILLDDEDVDIQYRIFQSNNTLIKIPGRTNNEILF